MTEPAPDTTSFNVQPAINTDETAEARRRLKENSETAGLVVVTATVTMAVFEVFCEILRFCNYWPVEEGVEATATSTFVSEPSPVGTVFKESVGVLEKPVSARIVKSVSVTVLVAIVAVMMVALILFWMFVSDLRQKTIEQKVLADTDVEGHTEKPVKATIPATDPIMIVAIFISMYSVSLIATLLIIIFNLLIGDWSWFPSGSIWQRFIILLFGFFSLQSVIALSVFLLYSTCSIFFRLASRHNIHNVVGVVICRLALIVIRLFMCLLYSLFLPTALYMKFVIGESLLFDFFVRNWKSFFALFNL